jgi:hypothetical protein
VGGRGGHLPAQLHRTARLGVSLLAVLFLGAAASGQELTLDYQQARRGLLYARIVLEDPHTVTHVARIDLQDEDLRIRMLKAHGQETLGEMVERVKSTGESILAAVNGDYFETSTEMGLPCGIQIDDSQIMFGPNGRAMFALGAGNQVRIGLASVHGAVKVGSRTFELEGYNLPMEFRKDRLGPVAYTPKVLTHTPPNIRAREWVVEGLPEGLLVGETAEGKIRELTRGGGTEIPQDGVVISVIRGIPKALEVAKPGDRILFKLVMPEVRGRILEAIGGGPVLVRRGRVDVNMDRDGFLPAHKSYLLYRQHPRTAVGYDKKERYLLLVVVEGRGQDSDGMDFHELAEFMRRIGAYEAMALDGGGSSMMYVEEFLVSTAWGTPENRRERLVANSIAVSLADQAQPDETPGDTPGESPGEEETPERGAPPR